MGQLCRSVLSRVTDDKEVRKADLISDTNEKEVKLIGEKERYSSHRVLVSQN